MRIYVRSLELYTEIALIYQNIELAIEDDLFLQTLPNNLELNIISHQRLHKRTKETDILCENIDKYLEFYTGKALICQNILLAIEDDF